MKYKLIAVTGIFNAGAIVDEMIFDTMDELQEKYYEITSSMSEEESEEFDFNSRIETVEDDIDV